MTESFERQFREELSEIPLRLTEDQLAQFFLYYEQLVQWNQVMNLTAITEIDEVITKHFVDSLSLTKAFDGLENTDYSLIDVGTGAGFPGIPLKIAYPGLKITLLDSLNKRVRFLNEMINVLELKKISAVHGRAEDLGRDGGYREKYDVCVSRAVANLSTLSEYCLPFVKVNGFFVSYKSGRLEEEITSGKRALEKLSGVLDDIIIFKLPNGDERSLVKIKKCKAMEKRYPRKAGVPSKEPL